jgi:hypothetical protein
MSAYSRIRLPVVVSVEVFAPSSWRLLGLERLGVRLLLRGLEVTGSSARRKLAVG